MRYSRLLSTRSEERIRIASSSEVDRSRKLPKKIPESKYDSPVCFECAWVSPVRDTQRREREEHLYILTLGKRSAMARSKCRHRTGRRRGTRSPLRPGGPVRSVMWTRVDQHPPAHQLCHKVATVCYWILIEASQLPVDDHNTHCQAPNTHYSSSPLYCHTIYFSTQLIEVSVALLFTAQIFCSTYQMKPIWILPKTTTTKQQ